MIFIRRLKILINFSTKTDYHFGDDEVNILKTFFPIGESNGINERCV